MNEPNNNQQLVMLFWSGELDEEQSAEVEALLRTDSELRDYYNDLCQLDAWTRQDGAQPNALSDDAISEVVASAFDGRAAVRVGVRRDDKEEKSAASRGMISLLVAACLAGMLFGAYSLAAYWSSDHAEENQTTKNESSPSGSKDDGQRKEVAAEEQVLQHSDPTTSVANTVESPSGEDHDPPNTKSRKRYQLAKAGSEFGSRIRSVRMRLKRHRSILDRRRST